jgi:hypothetical protein
MTVKNKPGFAIAVSRKVVGYSGDDVDIYTDRHLKRWTVPLLPALQSVSLSALQILSTLGLEPSRKGRAAACWIIFSLVTR